ncbi:MAG TPA: UbiA family prenyltransferase [candidate division Zixibacteria bacterium]|nr:UbiA family prenyltransferase [candidate division Zixibacteria bacterium]MDD4918228.1 UbiA family prenyltransferase [candidate division Zixibacteria bacterium]MDM7971608.1 UbiA family prenyltransferase [candidate division Zixibacteria bacterium]HOD66451.1 UbiA family prenyltransferase [candidate division Zixibacteria bacterium]HPM37254.1 UbiA family prenyltransferase [candidate division Zixibacteria bacterium]
MRWLDYLFAARPLLHVPVWSIYLVSLHYHQMASGREFHGEDLATPALLSLLCAGAYYLNQVYDREGDALNGKLGFLGPGRLSERGLLGAHLALSVLALAGAALLSWGLLLVFAQLLVLGYIYSAPPLRLKDRPFWGLAANAWSFGLLIPLTVMRDLSEHTVGLLGGDTPVYFLLAVGGTYLLTTIPDRAGDGATGKRTLAVVWPVGWVKAAALALTGLAAAVAWRGGLAELAGVALISLAPIAVTLLAPSPSSERLAAKAPIAILTLAAGWWFPAYLIFVVVLAAATSVYYRARFNQIYPRLT